MILQLLLISAIAVGPYKTREQAQHYLTILPGKFETYKVLYLKETDPEIKFRLKEIAYFKWCVETDQKFRDYDYYEDHAKINVKLQEEQFEKEIRR